MKNTMKKILSLVLAVIMIVCTMPMVFAESNTYKVGDIIQFGSYPQSKVTDEAIISELNSKAPTWDDWTSYGYYSGSGKYGSMNQGDWMRYVDIKHDGEKYRGVKFTQYRPYNTYSPSPNSPCQYDNGYRTNTVYWFKFESIDWRILDPSTGLVICKTIIDSQPYSNTIYENSGVSDSTYAYFNDDSYKNYASDYETSSIRQWLNNDFYNTAFTDDEKEEIITATLNNDGRKTSSEIAGYEKLDSNETKDKIFLLSYNEIGNFSFGFNSNRETNDKARMAQGSDYAKSQGLDVESSDPYTGNSDWLLRSPGEASNHCSTITVYGYICYTKYYYKPVCCTSYGVRPAIVLGSILHKHSYNLATINPTCTQNGLAFYYCACGYFYTETIPIKGHSYNSVVTAPTCTAQGYTTYICECGETFTRDYTSATNHIDNNSDYECDYGCGYEFEKPAVSTPDEPTNQTFIQKIINWFKNLINKLFGWLKR